MSDSSFAKGVLRVFKNHKSVVVFSAITVAGFIGSIKVLKDDSDTKWRRHEGIFKDRDRLNQRRIANGMAPMADEFSDPKLVEEWLEWKKKNGVKY